MPTCSVPVTLIHMNVMKCKYENQWQIAGSYFKTIWSYIYLDICIMLVILSYRKSTNKIIILRAGWVLFYSVCELRALVALTDREGGKLAHSQNKVSRF